MLMDQVIRLGEWEPQVRAVAWRWRQRGLDQDDLIQAGLQGLCEAALRYDAARGILGWATYAHLWIRRRISELTRQMGPIVSETQCERRRQVRKQEERRPLAWAALDRAAADEGDPEQELARAQALRQLAEEMGVREVTPWLLGELAELDEAA